MTVYRRSFMLNGQQQEVEISGHETLQYMLEQRLQLADCHNGCGRGDCGACTVIMDGQPVYACLVMAAEVEQSVIDTAQGLLGADSAGVVDSKYRRLVHAFSQPAMTLCQACKPGMLMSAKVLLDEVPLPTQSQIREAISGHLCRCAGYDQIVEAISAAAVSPEGLEGEP